jgi:DNA-binding CsgD family transcriptional regulator
LLDEVRAICEPLGAKPALARMDALMARLPAARSSAVAYPDGLTQREVDVLGLLASGNTSQEIADALFLSPRTIERHITSVYRKIDARGRADATAYALRHGLLRTD